jgi:hypothetical protein
LKFFKLITTFGAPADDIVGKLEWMPLYANAENRRTNEIPGSKY